MTAAADTSALLAAMHAELAALDSGEAARIETATADKLVALGALAESAALAPPERSTLEALRSLNRVAETRTRTLLRGVERRLAALRPGGPALCYGPDGRL